MQLSLGRTVGKLGFLSGKVAIERPRVRARSGAEMMLPSWQAAQVEDWLGCRRPSKASGD